MRKHWDTWGWIVPVAIIAIGFLRAILGRDAFCGDNTDQCFREWVSALGGWAAVAAAIPTVFYLSKQVKDAERANLVTFRIALRRNEALAKQTLRSIQDVQLACIFATNIWKKPPAHPAFLNQFKNDMDALAKALQDAPFQRFEDEIDVSTTYQVGDLLRYISALRKMDHVSVYDTNGDVALRENINDIVGMIADYVRGIEAVALGFLEYVAGVTKA